MSCIRPQILSDEQQSTESVLIEKISHENFGVQTFWNHSSVSYTFCSTHNSRIKSEVSAFLIRRSKKMLSQMKRSIQYETIFRNGSQYLDWLFHNTEGLRTHHFNYRDMLDWGRAVMSISSKLMNSVLCLHSHPTNRWNAMELQSTFEKICTWQRFYHQYQISNIWLLIFIEKTLMFIDRHNKRKKSISKTIWKSSQIAWCY